jgi:hypothetical protein
MPGLMGNGMQDAFFSILLDRLSAFGFRDRGITHAIAT